MCWNLLYTTMWSLWKTFHVCFSVAICVHFGNNTLVQLGQQEKEGIGYSDYLWMLNPICCAWFFFLLIPLWQSIGSEEVCSIPKWQKCIKSPILIINFPIFCSSIAHNLQYVIKCMWIWILPVIELINVKCFSFLVMVLPSCLLHIII